MSGAWVYSRERKRRKITMEEAFSMISLHSDLGIHTWVSGSTGKIQTKRFSDVSDDDIVSQFPEKPDDASDFADAFSKLSLMDRKVSVVNYTGISLALRFKEPKDLPGQEYPNKFPFTQGYIVDCLEP